MSATICWPWRRVGVPPYSQAAFAESYDIESLFRSGTYAFQRMTARRERLDDVLARDGYS